MEMDPQQDHALSCIFARNAAEAISVSKFKWFLYATDAFSTVVLHLLQKMLNKMKYTVIVAIDLDLNLVANTLHTSDCFSRTCSSNTGRPATC